MDLGKEAWQAISAEAQNFLSPKYAARALVCAVTRDHCRCGPVLCPGSAIVAASCGQARQQVPNLSQRYGNHRRPHPLPRLSPPSMRT